MHNYAVYKVIYSLDVSHNVSIRYEDVFYQRFLNMYVFVGSVIYIERARQASLQTFPYL